MRDILLVPCAWKSKDEGIKIQEVTHAYDTWGIEGYDEFMRNQKQKMQDKLLQESHERDLQNIE